MATIKTQYIGPPIPIRRYDWKAWFDGHEENSHIGYGSTEQHAIEDLKACDFCGDGECRCEHGKCLTCDECETCHDEGESLGVVMEKKMTNAQIDAAATKLQIHTWDMGDAGEQPPREFKYGGCLTFMSWLENHIHMFPYQVNQVRDAYEAFSWAARPSEPSTKCAWPFEGVCQGDDAEACLAANRCLKNLPEPSVPKVEPPRSCNRHDDCAKFDAEFKLKHNTDFVPFNQHCHDEECEDCFGQ